MPTNKQVMVVARSQIGYKESPAGSNRTKYGKWFGMNGVPWCAEFVVWCGARAKKKYGGKNPFPHNANAAYLQDEIVSKMGGKWIMAKTTKKATRKSALKKYKAGDVVCFDFGAYDAYRRHIGLVDKVDGDYVYCVEGNTSANGSQSNGGMVCRKKRHYSDICSCARPKYDKEQKTPSEALTPSSQGENASADKLVDEPNKIEKISEKVLDISAWQDKVSEADWKKVIKDGITCVILRSSYTKQKEFKMFKDSVFDHNIRTAIKAGMHIGIYHYSQATTEAEAEKEADFCLNVIAPYRKHIDLPVAFDWEFGVRLNPTVAKKNGKTKNTAICTVFCNRVQRAGYDTMVYANLSTLNNYLSTTLAKLWKVWVAQYNKTCDYKQPWYLWQYTSSGSCSGISGKLDVSRFKEVPKKPDSPKPTPDAPKTDSILPKRGYFKNGDTGANVKEMQKMLNKANEGAYWSIREDGVFGDKTESYVRILEDARHLDIDGKFDEKCLKQCEKKVTLQMRAINFAISIVRDNSFAYGTGERAHRYGCYFCKTNTGDRMYKKQRKGEPKYVKDSKGNKHTYEKTYCCNPFITACYAHGAGIKKVLEACRNGSGGGMSPSTWTRYGFKTVGKTAKLKFDDLKKGDILITDKHVCMYTGGDWLTEASGGTWSAKSIAHKKGAKKRFNTYQKNSKSYVMRYVEPVKVSDELKKQLP